MYGRSLLVALLALLVVVTMGSVLDVMGVDAAQYAGMARDMLSFEHSPHDATWLKLYFRDADYLDKPPLLFWLSAISFKLFGVHNWSYKLPSILYAFLGMYATYRFARLHHTEAIARTAALMFGGSAAFILMTNDVRTDTILTASVITAIWLGAAWLEERRWWQLMGASVSVASGMLAKGPMGLMAPALALGGHVLLARRWDVLRDPRLLVVPVVVGILLVPMCIGLYEQHGPHGLRFYFWEQSFGRITGENRWKDDSTFLYFSHEVLWQLLPWTVFLLAGLWVAIRDLVKQRPSPEYTSLSGALLVFVAISLSRYKLPHYLYVVMPLFAVIAAKGWHSARSSMLMNIHMAVLALVWSMALLLVGWAFPEGGLPFLALLVLVAGSALLRLRRDPGKEARFTITYQVLIAVAIVLNGHFYPHLFRYHAPANAGRWASTQGLGVDRFYGMQLSGTALDFYAGYPVRWLSNAEEAARVVAPGIAIYTDAPRMHELLEAGLVPRERFILQDYPVQLLSLDFLLPAQREAALSTHYILRY
jgi:4-amino-4-deoxy-L-arabinose transferase-like glycosyltransferase